MWHSPATSHKLHSPLLHPYPEPRLPSPHTTLRPTARVSRADLYAIIKTTEKLERAYVRDLITAQEYEPACQKLIAQFKTLWSSMRETVGGLQDVMHDDHGCPPACLLACLPSCCGHL
jgi:hypothetical protein